MRDWPLKRIWASKLACAAGRLVTPVRDSTSGFFAVRKSALEGAVLNPLGFKIGLEVFVRARHGGKIREIPYVFTDRLKGKSKLGLYVIGCYFKQVFLLLGKKAPGK